MASQRNGSVRRLANGAKNLRKRNQQNGGGAFGTDAEPSLAADVKATRPFAVNNSLLQPTLSTLRTRTSAVPFTIPVSPFSFLLSFFSLPRLDCAR
jgi:hypothetical protein